jgi:hypothetical protein
VSAPDDDVGVARNEVESMEQRLGSEAVIVGEVAQGVSNVGSGAESATVAEYLRCKRRFR